MKNYYYYILSQPCKTPNCRNNILYPNSDPEDANCSSTIASKYLSTHHGRYVEPDVTTVISYLSLNI